MSTPITSAGNERLKELRKLRDRRHRERTGLFAGEGEDMLTEALRYGAQPRTVFYDNDRMSPDAHPLSALGDGCELVAVQGDALAASSALGSGSRVIAVWPQRLAPLTNGDASEVVVYLHEVADPGNVGTVLRAALALVPSLVVLSPGCADPFGPKAARASMGAVFGQPVARASFHDVRAALGGGRRSVALVPRAGTPLREADLSGRVLICLGGERLGVPDYVQSACEEVAHVPLQEGGAESLNVAMTATLCLYECARTRRHILSSR